MLNAALVLAFVAFVAFVFYILNAATWMLVIVFISAGLGIVLFIIDSVSKMRRGKDLHKH
ncbi:hypothetical protein VVR26_02085 [Corynebacterium camporealensis]|uniref:hypothetical protein n=1 Tax=Corynebacterium camporealensis TaxID=161896 RepID=UPI0034CEEADA